MDSQRWLFQIEDGTPLSFAIHESVPQHDQLREVIDVRFVFELFPIG
jgi:hypothetical protein